MKTNDFRKYTTEKTLQDLIQVTLEGKELSRIIRTPRGNVFRDIAVTPTSKRTWSAIKSPILVSSCIPGLEKFSCEGMYVGAKIIEDHFMFLSTNRYEGSIFHYDEKEKIWGMTNHPAKDNNHLDIPHNVVYTLNEREGFAAIGVEYCSSGYLGSNWLAERITRESMQYAMQKVVEKIQSGGKK